MTSGARVTAALGFAAAALTMTLTGCSGSSGSSSANASGGPCDKACQASIDAANTSYLASLSAAVADPAPSAIVDHYDTATCADWKVTGPADRSTAAAYYASEYNDPQPASDLDSLVKIITTTCAAYGAGETPTHVAKVSIATVYGGH